MRLAVFAVLLSSTTAFADYSDPLTPIDPTGLDLVWKPTANLPTANLVTLDAVLASANHSLYPCPANTSLPIAPAAMTAYCFEAGDTTTTAWSSQSITTSGEAYTTGLAGTSHHVMLTGWHFDTDGDRYNEARVSFIDLDKLNYRWAYLVDENLAPIQAHGGGMVWNGDKIYVVAVGNGTTALRVFSTNNIVKASVNGYAYALVQIGTYEYKAGACSMADDQHTPCLSSISLDRSTTPVSVVTTEYFSDQTMHGRLIRYPTTGTAFLLAGTASEAFRSGVANMQGVMSWMGTWWVAHSSADYHGQLWRQTTTASEVQTCTTADPSSAMCWGLHPEALTYSPATNLVWSITEYPDTRALFAVPLDRLMSPGGNATDAGVDIDDPGTPDDPQHSGGCNAGANTSPLIALVLLGLLRRHRRFDMIKRGTSWKPIR
ncbi:MAG: hypothetical protein QM831_28560 [Kofleriaceae bacterium]